jgi:hypothetical protein
LLGESYGGFGFLYWILLGYLCQISASKKVDKPESDLPGFKLALFILSSVSIYWIYFFFRMNSLRPFSIPGSAIANLGTLIASFYGIFQMKKLLGYEALIKSFIILVSVFSFSIIPKGVIEDCTNLTFPSRPYIYEICLGHGVRVSNRLSGFAAEPGLFAAMVVFATILLLNYRITRSRTIHLLLLSNFTLAIFNTKSTAGIILFSVASTLYLVLKTRNKKLMVPIVAFVLAFGALLSSTLLSLVDSTLTQKYTRNSRSITDRSLDLNIGSYFNKWMENPFGEISATYSLRGFGINLLTESIVIGPLTILLMLGTLLGALRFSRAKVKDIQILITVFLSCLFSQPAWFNPIWMVVIYLVMNTETNNRNSEILTSSRIPRKRTWVRK